MAVFAASTLVSAFLLFQLQPMVAKAILAWFGGSPSVWTTSVLFFQTLLLGGYAYAHLIATRLSPQSQAKVHLSLLAATLLFLPLAVSPTWKPSGGEEPAARIIALLVASIGLPYFALSTTAPLVQSWAAIDHPSPYRLYALGNAGSLAALLSYPLLVEPMLTTGQQFGLWSAGYVAYAILTGLAALRAGRLGSVAPPGGGGTTSSRSRRLLWCALPACASLLLLAVTNQICQDVAVVPFLWLLPLTLYLLSFIVCFDAEHRYRRRVFLPALLAASAAVTYAVLHRAELAARIAIPVYAVHLFVACMVCHGELVGLRPPRNDLTRFYLMVSLGGALGAAFVALAAPVLFPLYFELHLAIVACLVLAATTVIAGSPASFRARRWSWLVWFEATLAMAALLWVGASEARNVARVAARNFYGALRVVDIEDVSESVQRRHLIHGLTDHGFQFHSAERRNQATSYYGPGSAVGILLTTLRPGSARRVAALGLGVGTIAAYGRRGDVFRFFEINPLVVHLAQSEFTFLAKSAARVEVVVGDARLALEHDHGPPYDVVVADAFSSDAIPVHLLTEEAFRLYVDRLTPAGVLAIHISNRVLDLRPVVAAASSALGLHCLFLDSDPSPTAGWFKAEWVLLSRDDAFVTAARFDEPGMHRIPPPAKRILWRDDYSNLLQIVK